MLKKRGSDAPVAGVAALAVTIFLLGLAVTLRAGYSWIT